MWWEKKIRGKGGGTLKQPKGTYRSEESSIRPKGGGDTVLGLSTWGGVPNFREMSSARRTVSIWRHDDFRIRHITLLHNAP